MEPELNSGQLLSQITVGILTWQRPSTLRYTLASYRKAGLLDAVGETILFANQADPREAALAKTYGLRLLFNPQNIGIGPAFARLAEAAAHPFFLFLENDWPCIEPKVVALRRLAQGVRLLHGNKADAVQLRHRSKYGHPLYSRARCEGRELEAENALHLLDSVHWRDHPGADFPDHLTRRVLDGEDWFFAKAAHAAYSNNPSLYRTGFAAAEIGPRGDVTGTKSEEVLQNWWQTQAFTVAKGPGLFTHRDPGKEWRRARKTLTDLLRRSLSGKPA